MSRKPEISSKPVSAVLRRLGLSAARSKSSDYLRHRLGKCTFLVILLALGFASVARAEESGIDSPGEARTQLDPDETHPIYSTSSTWVVSLLIGSVGLFLAALVIGPIVRAEAPEAVPAAMSHEEDPAADRH